MQKKGNDYKKGQKGRRRRKEPYLKDSKEIKQKGMEKGRRGKWEKGF